MSIIGFNNLVEKSYTDPNHFGEICIKRYPNLIKNQQSKEIEVWLDSQGGLSASIAFFNCKGDLIDRLTYLKLEGLSGGLPKQIISAKDIKVLTHYLANTHAIPEKGSDGIYNRVRVHVSGNGGGRSRIPFQPGLALGSVVRGSSLENMEQYSEEMTQKQMFEEQINNAEEEIELLEAKIKARKSVKGKDDDDPLIKNWNEQKKAINVCVAELSSKMANVKMKIPIFEGFQQALESPIDMEGSQLDIQPRGFDSLEYTSQYIRRDEDISEIHNKMTQSSSANSVSLGGSGGWGLWKASAKASHSWANAAADRVSQILKEEKAEGVLVINAFVTTRNVRCFKELKYDYSKLKNILQAMENGTPEQLKRYGITVSEENKKEIYLLTEAVLGGAFTALVTFLDVKKMSQEAQAKFAESSKATSVTGKVGFTFFSANTGGSRSSSDASQSEDDVLKNLGTTKVNIEMFAHGAIPAFGRNIVSHEVFKFLNLDPSKFELTKKEEADIEAFIKAEGQAKEIAVAKQEMKLAKNQEAFLNNYRALTSDKKTQNIHTLESVMSAYEDFSKQITQDKDCGIPVGFNYRVLTQSNIQELIEENKKVSNQGKSNLAEEKKITKKNNSQAGERTGLSDKDVQQ